ncbi:MAG: hypothetical protein WA966_13140 [Ornithinimicrobium sp.]
MGINSSELEPDDRIPAWDGDTSKKQDLSRFVWIAVGFLAFLFFNSEMPADDGFGGYIPLILAWLIAACGLMATERYFLRSATRNQEEQD